MSRRSEDHQQAAEASGALAECCGKMAETFSGMAKAAGDDGPTYQKIADNWKSMAKVHSDSNEYHLGACTSAKAEEAEFEKRLVPDNVRAVAPGDTPGFGIRAVARPGAPDTTIDKARIPIQFRNLIAGDDDDNL